MNLLRIKELDTVLTGIIRKNMDDLTWCWLQEKILLLKKDSTANQLPVVFSSIQRKTSKLIVRLEDEELKQIEIVFPSFSIHNWSVQRLSRVWLLMQLNSSSKENYIKNIASVFRNAEMNELVALYSALPVLAYPDEWKMCCADGIRSNIAPVLEAIMLDNPYPAAYLGEDAWNQMVLKAFFTEKDIDRIVGLSERNNKHLAATLFDYAQERIAAGREVNKKLWPLVEKFSAEKIK